MIKLYADGSAAPNPGPGGFGVVALDENNNIVTHYSQKNEYTTNNREELKALLLAVSYSNTYWRSQVPVYTDSAYCCNIYNTWMHGWAQNNWTKKSSGQIENLDIIKLLYKEYYNGFQPVEVIHIKGHNGELGNELADALATGNQAKFQKLVN